AAGERVIVCLDPSPDAANTVRAAKRTADGLNAELIALYVETQRHALLSEAEQTHLSEAMQLATQLGAEVVTAPGRTVVEEILTFARSRNATRVVVGKSRRSRWFEIRHGSVVDELVRSSSGLAVEVAPSGGKPQPAGTIDWLLGAPQSIGPYFEGLLTTALATALGVLIDSYVDLPNISLIYVVPVMVAAARHGLVPSLWVAALAVLSYNFFFLPPLYRLTIADPANIVALFFFMFVAIVASALGTRTRAQAQAARREARTTADLYAFSRKIAGVIDLDDLLWIVVTHLARLLTAEVAVLMPDRSRQKDGRLSLHAAFPPDSEFTDADLAAARWCWDAEQPTGKGTDTLPGGRWLFVPIRTSRAPIGVVGILSSGDQRALSDSERRLLEAVGNQAAVAIERVVLAADIDQARIGAERERLRSAMLTSVSHDLRTPLASIIGSLTSLRSYGRRYDDAAREGLMATIQAEAERLNRFIGNLLDMTRLESGAIELKPEPVDLGEIIGTALQRAGRLLAEHRVEVEVAPDLPPLSLDYLLLEQALFNLLDNAAKYAQPGSLIRVAARREGALAALSVSDEGPGVPAGDLEHIFDKFYRVHRQDRQRAGTGLGLAVCRGFVAAMGASITAANRGDRSGAVFTIRIPAAGIEAAPPLAVTHGS
ncbi:MAG TPA: DUF4118 domain-containing protein, partial [Stellaceae bacterium]|nr:DUF4118 domain-containing protein [Stellaceae bacterium]